MPQGINQYHDNETKSNGNAYVCYFSIGLLINNDGSCTTKYKEKTAQDSATYFRIQKS